MQIDLEHIVCFGTKRGKSRCEDDPDSITRNHWRPTYLVVHSAIWQFYQLSAFSTRWFDYYSKSRFNAKHPVSYVTGKMKA